MKYLSLIRYVLIIVSVLVVLLPFLQSGGGEVTNVDTMLNWAKVLIYITIGIVIVMPAINVAKNPQGAVRTLVGVLIVGGIFAISYVLSDSTPIEVSEFKVYDNETELKLSDTGLFMTYISFSGAVLCILFGEVYKLFK